MHELPASSRLDQTTPALEQAEQAWWQRFAEVEDQFCWVQTPAIQRFLRARYINRIISLCPPGGRIADLGCGVGWISILLGQFGASDVWGIDFSEAQINLAREKVRAAGLQARVHFQVASATHIDEVVEKFDVIIIHGFLHHLTVSEIDHALDSAHRLLKPSGKLVVLEPMVARQRSATFINKILRRLLIKLLDVAGLRFPWRPHSAAEKETRQLISQRNVGLPPFGPSPKELGFSAGELERFLSRRFTVERSKAYLSISHKVAEENLLAELTFPRLAKAIRWPVLFLTRTLEQHLLARGVAPGMWIFQMLECVPQNNFEGDEH